MGDCRRTDTVREFSADRSRDFIGSRPFTPFWRLCRKAFLTAPYKNCTLQDHNSARISASLPELVCGRALVARTFAVHDQISIAIIIEAPAELTIWPRTTRELGLPSCMDFARTAAHIEHGNML